MCGRRRVPPNPSIELTCPGRPGHAAHVKRWASQSIMVFHRTLVEEQFNPVPSFTDVGASKQRSSQARPRRVPLANCQRRHCSQSVGAAALLASVTLGQVLKGPQRHTPSLHRRLTPAYSQRSNELASVGAKAPPSENVGQSVGAAAQRTVSAFPSSGTGGSGSVAGSRPLALPTSVTPNPSFKRTGLRPAAYVQR